ncbi:DUF2000 domain-containing protein [Inquilinus sp. NPDC058860]|uniref:DUF2000 domain-containing protein n=1 Tax=Inquilinus sp. NPDC058860 TaxID=3346652 RepID=UPI003689C0B1
MIYLEADVSRQILPIVVNPGLPLGLIANTAGAIAIGLGARLPALAARRLTDRRDRTIDISSNQPVPVLQADAEAIRALLLKALAQPPVEGVGERAVVPFPAFARSLHAYAEYEAAFPARDLGEEAIDGLGLAGPAKWVKSLTGSLKLLR